MTDNSANKNYILLAIVGISTFISGLGHYKEFYDWLFGLVGNKYLSIAIILACVAIVILVLYVLNHYVFKFQISRKNEGIENLTPNDGIAHITYFWEKRDQASQEITKTLLECNKYSNVFISAIGLGTVKEALTSNSVIEQIVKCISEDNSNFKIQIVFPAESSSDFRPEMENLKENIENGHNLIIGFIAALKKKLAPSISLQKHITLSNYDINIGNNNIKHTVIPRHFILQTGNVIFVGPYLAQEEGKNSFLMKLEKPVKNITQKGMYSIYLNEIEYLKQHSTESNKISI